MRNRLMSLALVMVLALSLSGLVAAQDKTKIRLWTSSSSPAEDKAKTAQVEAFKKANPDIEVEMQILPDFGTQIQAAFASGDYPEVFNVGQFDFPTFADSGVIAAGGDKIPDQKDIYPGLLAAFTKDGTPYCVPKDFSTLGLLYNKDLFDKAGVKYPTADWTWQDMADAAKKLTSGGVVGLSAAADRNRWMSFFYGNGGEVFDKDGKVAFNSDAAVAALDFYNSFVKDGTGKTPKDLDSGWNGEAFGKGKAAMTIEGNWAIGYLAENFPDLKWGVAELPIAPATGKHGTLTFTECWAVGAAATGKVADAAWKLVNFLTDKDGAMTVATAGFGVMPSRASAADAWLAGKGHEELGAFVKGAEYAIAPVFPLGYADFTKSVDDGTNAVIAGTQTAKEMMDAAAAVAEDIKTNG